MVIDMGYLFITDILIMLIPLFISQIALFIYCLHLIIRDDVNNLSKSIWILICLILIIGPIAFLIVGKKQDKIF